MRSLVTGCAGFIGSHLAERLVEIGHEVIGIDSLNSTYSVEIKKENLKRLKDSRQFKFHQQNLLSINLHDILQGIDFIFHQAAQGGVRASWGKHFESYINNNILATQVLLEAAKDKRLKKFIYASSSSVYGDCTLPMKEDARPNPTSPYGVTKLAAENLCQLYNRDFALPTTSLRYFSVYGPRQRPDMAFHKFIKAILKEEKIVVYGSGKQTRDFTYVDDVVEANILAMSSDISGEIFNIGGGIRIELNAAIDLISKLIGKKPKIEFSSCQKGDLKDTQADVEKASQLLSFSPSVKIEEGLTKEIKWIENYVSSAQW